MPTKRNRFYLLFFIIFFVGFIWLYFNLKGYVGKQNDGYGVCIFKEVTGLACPSCGSTRSVVELLKGNIINAFYWNPLGFFIFAILMILPFWLFYDVLFNKSSFMLFYKHMEKVFTLKYIAIPAIILILLNWIWNIKKGL